MPKKNLKHCLALLVFTLGNYVSANSLSSYGWDINAKALLATQAAEDVALLPKAVEKTKAAACTFEKELPDSGVKRMLMVRISSGHEVVLGYEHIWLLYRTEEKAVVTEVVMTYAGDRVFDSFTREVPIRKWDAIFEKFVRHQQRSPTPPYKERQPLLDGRNWPRGYAGLVNTFEDGKTRAYLLATDDLWRLHVQGPIEEAICRLLAGMHCRVGAEVKHGWALQGLHSLLEKSPSPIRTTTKDFVGQIHEDCLPK